MSPAHFNNLTPEGQSQLRRVLSRVCRPACEAKCGNRVAHGFCDECAAMLPPELLQALNMTPGIRLLTAQRIAREWVQG
ncbi:MAG TPA: hypothetical protein VGD87_12720, partial [Archangium sp.]